jgi:hypothetical protein
MIGSDLVQEYPLLRSRGLTPTELAALRSQGFVSSELRGEKTIYKLRYRVDGRQRVRCLGNDASTAKGIEQELAVMQTAVRTDRQLTKLHRNLRIVLRESKTRLEPLLESRGIRFHGHKIRQTRNHEGI